MSEGSGRGVSPDATGCRVEVSHDEWLVAEVSVDVPHVLFTLWANSAALCT